MRVKFDYFNNPIKLDDKIQIIVLENKKLFRKILYCFAKDNECEMFSFSQNFEPFEFGKKGIFIDNPLDYNLDDKKILTKVNNYMGNIVNDDYFCEIEEIKKDIYALEEKLTKESEYDFVAKNELDTLSIIKLMNFSINEERDSPCERLIRKILLIKKYLGISFFILANIFIYFTEEEVEGIIKTLKINNVILLLLENTIYDYNKIDILEVNILDKDFCQIDNS